MTVFDLLNAELSELSQLTVFHVLVFLAIVKVAWTIADVAVNWLFDNSVDKTETPAIPE